MASSGQAKILYRQALTDSANGRYNARVSQGQALTPRDKETAMVAKRMSESERRAVAGLADYCPGGRSALTALERLRFERRYHDAWERAEAALDLTFTD